MEVFIGVIYVYNVNFFGGFGVLVFVYWGLCKFSFIFVCSDKWMEVGDEIDDLRVVYDVDNVSGMGSQEYVFGKGEKDVGRVV